jgi:hypothetical protein
LLVIRIIFNHFFVDVFAKHLEKLQYHRLVIKKFGSGYEVLGFISQHLVFVAGRSNCRFSLWFAHINDEIKKGEITRAETTRLNYHLALNHSQLEDPMLFVAIGAPFFWVSLPRYIFSVLVVWIIVLAQNIKHKYTAVQ